MAQNPVKMKKIKKEMLGALKTVSQGSVKHIVYSWPPACNFLLHQPKRLKKKENVEK